MTGIGNFEELVLLAIDALGGSAYCSSIHRQLEACEYQTSDGAVHATLRRLERKRYLNSHEAGVGPSGRGRPIVKYHLTLTGFRELNKQHRYRQALRAAKEQKART